jgi:hypothetical protein
VRGFFILMLLAVFKITCSQNTQAILNANQYPVRDTVFTYAVNKIPKGILLALPPLQQNIKHKQSFIIKNAWLYNNRLLMFVRQASNKVSAPAADKCYQIMTDVDGSTCAMAGCITGNGSGDCAALRNAVNKIPYSVKVFITL